MEVEVEVEVEVGVEAEMEVESANWEVYVPIPVARTLWAFIEAWAKAWPGPSAIRGMTDDWKVNG